MLYNKDFWERSVGEREPFWERDMPGVCRESACVWRHSGRLVQQPTHAQKGEAHIAWRICWCWASRIHSLTAVSRSRSACSSFGLTRTSWTKLPLDWRMARVPDQETQIIPEPLPPLPLPLPRQRHPNSRGKLTLARSHIASDCL